MFIYKGVVKIIPTVTKICATADAKTYNRKINLLAKLYGLKLNEM